MSDMIVARSPMDVQSSGPWMSPSPVNLYGFVASMVSGPLDSDAFGDDDSAHSSAELSHSFKVRIIVETRRDRPRIVRNRCVPVCGYRAGYFGLGLRARLPEAISFGPRLCG